MEPKIIFVAGGSASGKTTLSQQIIDHFNNRAILLAQDSFYRGSNNSNVNFDLPSSMDFKLMRKTLIALKKGQKVQIPVYDFVSHKATGKTWLEPKEIVIFEGLFTFYDPELTKLADF
ncbi:zeta toxin family protein [Mycoplasma sp. ATU-Cv-508]